MGAQSEILEVGAAVILGVDLFCGVRLRWYGEHRDAAGIRWTALSRAEKDAWIARAQAVLLCYAPAPVPSRTIVTGLGGKVIGQISSQAPTPRGSVILPAGNGGVKDRVDRAVENNGHLLCFYCARHPVMDGSDYCSTECVINAENEGA